MAMNGKLAQVSQLFLPMFKPFLGIFSHQLIVTKAIIHLITNYMPALVQRALYTPYHLVFIQILPCNGSVIPRSPMEE